MHCVPSSPQQTVSAVRTFFLMMVRHPEIQRKAQAECDSVVGPERLPNIMDRPSMPYLNCVMKEVLRFCSIVPLMPHSLDSDDVRSSSHPFFLHTAHKQVVYRFMKGFSSRKTHG